ncbi:SusD/RagB family nutrient-binding outer membrane lipoprotein [Paraflavitalea sp. CAU 1676]|uniref:SusD/RagB family nutrient-binding outer membrane lipoprotein n=1 Tax=Paraflavitalea sp. CAU 1676 TaxID=3032598 RepID=UPI0023DBFE09|nr:SusD/RagB family nutrient-binding outer membrane lipoprotein [Paraflavitalea sp. CAU 1676]MDF2192246.1 SusD/RagB family nutrient-binding outer membrane lipoprotein [Paraflavitalea sp. CAU 1676]
MKSTFVKYITSCLLVATVVTSCSKPGDFGDMNVDPNNPSDPNTALLLTSAMRSSLSSGTGAVTAADPLLYVQHISEVIYTTASLYTSRIFDYNGLYNGPLNDLQTIIKLNSNAETKSKPYVLAGGSNANQLAAARILKAHIFMQMTDRWGDIPYSAAFQGVEDITPEFDEQKVVYQALLKELKEAIAQIDNGAGPTGDILLGGDMGWWKEWANSIRMIIGLRLSIADPTTGKAEFADASTAGGLAGNSHNVFYQYLADANNQNPWYNNYNIGKRYDYAISETMVNKLKSLSDPRLPVFADLTSAGTYVGMPYGLKTVPNGVSAGTVDAPGTISLIGRTFRLQGSKAAVTTYAQIQFAKAEAAHLGWIGGGEAAAETFYLAGIKASLEQFGVGASYATYIAQPAVAYNAAKAVETIQNQKWIASYLGNGYEAWAEWRRTGFPVLTPAKDAAPVSGGQIPRRQAYPTTERDLNTANYNTVIQRQGADELTTKTWVEKP